MNNILSKIITGKIGRAQKLVVYAPEGFGKSTLASQFPAPVFLDIEGGTAQLEVARIGRESLPDLVAFEKAIDEIIASRLYKTFVIDTADWLESMAVDAIISDSKGSDKEISSVEDFGYGKGYVILKEKFTIILSWFDRAITAGMNVVLLAHSVVKKFEPPDGAGAYDRYELKLSKHVAPLVKEWADAVLFGNWKTQIKEKEKNKPGQQFKGVGGKSRLLFTTRCSTHDAKNRHGLADEETWSIAVIEKAFKSVNAPWLISAGATTNTADSRVSLAVECEKVNGSEFSERKSKKSPDALLEIRADEIPIISKEDEDFLRICEPVKAEAIEYLRSSGKIGLAAGLASVPMDYKLRVLKNPAGFLNVVKGAAK